MKKFTIFFLKYYSEKIHKFYLNYPLFLLKLPEKILKLVVDFDFL